MVIRDRMEIEGQKEYSLRRTKSTGQESGGSGSLVSQYLHLSGGIIILVRPTLPGCTEDQERQYSRIQSMLYNTGNNKVLKCDYSKTLTFYKLANQDLER